jgi:multiple sugar transport system substrate-binding protein
MNVRDRKQRLYVAQQGEKLAAGKISRREFLRRAALAGFAVSAAGMMRYNTARAGVPTPRTPVMPMQNDAMTKWLTEVGGRFRGQTVRISSESTAPSQVISDLAAKEFTELTGIEIKWEQTPLDQVLTKITRDTAEESASNDIYYLDQAWVGRFVEDTVDPMEYMSNTGSDLNMPDYQFDDFVPELVKVIASYQGRLVGLPFDIPIFIMSYRQDVFEKLGLSAPTTMAEYLDVARKINEAKLTNEDGSQIFGTVGQWRSGHYALQCDWTAWLWSHGGSHTGKDGTVVIDDEFAVKGAEYMLELGKTMPAAATTYDWSGQGDSVGAGSAGIVINWGEFFPSWDNPETSKVAGKMMPVSLPKEDALRTAADCSFDETPGIGHQGGSCLALSKYSQVKDAAWVFLQWATSPDIVVRASIEGGSVTPVRTSAFNDPRTKELEKAQAGTTRHFPITLETIQTRMGTEPHFPGWAAASGTGGPIPTELGLMTTGSQDVATTLANIKKAIEAGIAEG